MLQLKITKETFEVKVPLEDNGDFQKTIGEM